MYGLGIHQPLRWFIGLCGLCVNGEIQDILRALILAFHHVGP